MVFHKLVSDEERFWGRVDRDGPIPERRPDLGPCWLWLGSTIRGYGQFPVGSRTDMSRRMLKAHRFAYESMVGAIPEGLTIDHLCFVKSCVKPAHLEPVTAGVNVLRNTGPTAANAAKTACPQGHPFDAMSTRGRVCSTCRREAQARFRERHPDRVRATAKIQNAKAAARRQAAGANV